MVFREFPHFDRTALVKCTKRVPQNIWRQTNRTKTLKIAIISLKNVILIINRSTYRLLKKVTKCEQIIQYFSQTKSKWGIRLFILIDLKGRDNNETWFKLVFVFATIWLYLKENRHS